VALQLEDILARERLGPDEAQREPLVDGRSGGIAERGEGGDARERKAAEDRLGDLRGLRTRDAHDPDAAATAGRGDGGDGPPA
jgi:hypothetical protein